MATPVIVANAAVAVAADLKQYDADLKQAETSGTGTGSRLAAALKRDFGGAATALAGTVGALFGGALKFGNELTDTIANYRAETGATAEEAQQAKGIIDDLYRSGTDGFTALGDALAIVHNDMGLVGEDAKTALELSRAFARATGQELVPATQELAGLTKAYNLDAAGQVSILDELVASHEKYGGSILDNVTVLQTLAPALLAANLTWSDGIGILNLFTKAGVDAAAAPAALTKALSKVKSPAELQQLITDIANTVDPLQRAQKAADLFGVKAGPKLADALAGSNGDLQQFTVSADQAAGATEKAAAAIDNTPLEQFKVLLHQVTGPLADFGSALSTPVQTLGSLASAAALFGIAEDKLTISTLRETAAGWLSVGALKARQIAYLLMHPQFLLTAIQLGVLAVAEGVYTVATTIATAATTALGVAIGFLTSPLGIVLIAIGLLFAAWNTNFLGIRDLVGGVVQFVADHLGFLLGPIKVVADALGGVLDFIGHVVTGIHDFLFGADTAIKDGSDKMIADVHARGDDWYNEGTTAAQQYTAAQHAQLVGATLQSLRGDLKAETDAIRAHKDEVAAAAAFAALPIGEQIRKQGPAAIRAAANVVLGAAQAIRDKRSAIDSAMSQLTTDIKNRMSRTKEIGHDAGLLLGKELADSLHASDPVVKKQAEGTRDLIEARLVELGIKMSDLGKDGQKKLQDALHSKDPDIKAQAERTKSLIDTALQKKTTPKTPGDAIGDQLVSDLGTKNTPLYNVAYRMGRNIYDGLYDGVKGAYSAPAPTGSGSGSRSQPGTTNAGYALGTSYVPHDMLAYIHKGEAVLKPSDAEIYRAVGLGGGGPLIGQLNVDASGHPDPEAVGDAVEQAVSNAMAKTLRDETLRGYRGALP